MRIISGSAKGRKLAGFSGNRIRPTSDRVREALFSILTSQLGSITGRAVLDLFAGTGALGLEALSRGAAVAHMIDSGPQSARLVTSNAKTCGLEQKVHFHRGDVVKTLPKIAERGPFDLIFLDPPYGQGLAKTTLEVISELGLLAEGGIVCAEASATEGMPEHTGDLTCILRRRYGSTLIMFFSQPEPEA